LAGPYVRHLVVASSCGVNTGHYHLFTELLFSYGGCQIFYVRYNELSLWFNTANLVSLLTQVSRLTNETRGLDFK
jgi:hypothetical protein